MKVKLRKVIKGKTIDFHVIQIKTIDELRYMEGPGLTEGAIDILRKTSNVIVRFKGDPMGELHVHIVGD